MPGALSAGARAESFTLLTPAERIVVAYLTHGLSNKEIASALGKAEATVKHQVGSILQKTGVPTRLRLMAMLGAPSSLLAGTGFDHRTKTAAGTCANAVGGGQFMAKETACPEQAGEVCP